jgi:uncharacterized protein DUF559
MGGLPDPDWYLDNVLVHARPGTARLDRAGPVESWLQWWRAVEGWTPDVSRQLRRQGFVLSMRQLAMAGSSRQRSRTLVSRGEWYRPARGTVAPVDLRDDDPMVVRVRRHALDAAGAALRQPGHVVSGRSAAIPDGLPTFAVPRRPELTDPDQNWLGRNAVSHVHGARIEHSDVGYWFGVPRTSTARTLVDLARHDRRDAIMAADAALRADLVTAGDIAAALSQAAGWPGVRQAREVLALADPRAGSPLESLTRLVLHDDGFPAPDLQKWIGRDRVDMVFEAQRLVLEIDGLRKYTAADRREEKMRERRLRRHGYRVERVTWDEVVHHWPPTRAWLRDALGLPA